VSSRREVASRLFFDHDFMAGWRRRPSVPHEPARLSCWVDAPGVMAGHGGTAQRLPEEIKAT
jgi:hypothetical protein